MSPSAAGLRLPLRSYRLLLVRYLAPDRARLAVLAAVLGSGIAVRLVAPWLAARFIDRATGAGAGEAGAGEAGAGAGAGEQILGVLVWLAGAYLVAGVVDQLLAVATAHLGAQLAWRATNRLREETVDHCLRLDPPFHHRHGPGVMVERVDGDVRELNNFFAEFGLRVAGNLLLLAAALTIVYLVDWRIGLVFTGFSALALVVFHRVRGVAAPHWQRSREASAALYGEVEERFTGIPDIRASGAGGYVFRRFARRLRRSYRLTRRATAVSVAVGQGAGLVMGLGTVAILAGSAALHLRGSMSLGTVVAMAMYAAIVAAPLREIIRQVDDLQRATASIERVRELLATTPSVRSGPGADWPDGPLPVVFEDVSFRYPGTGDRPALTGVSFVLRPGELLGLVGRTGAGKSTVVRLLLRLYDPDQGRITVAGTDLREASLAQLRRRVGVVTQEVQLFRASLRDNLTLFDPAVPDDRLVAVLAEVGLGGWFARQPDGLDTPLGTALSAGEAQLLGVARVFLADPAVVLLDEPTSRLDPATERLLDSAFRPAAGRPDRGDRGAPAADPAPGRHGAAAGRRRGGRTLGGGTLMPAAGLRRTVR